MGVEKSDSPQVCPVYSKYTLRHIAIRATYQATKVTDCDISGNALPGCPPRNDCRSDWSNLQSRKQRTFGTSSDHRTGCAVPENGFYRVMHSQHRLPKEVTLIVGQSFPGCSKCAEPIYFELIRPARFLGMNGSRFKVTLYELPELTDQDDSLAA